MPPVGKIFFMSLSLLMPVTAVHASILPHSPIEAAIRSLDPAFQAEPSNLSIVQDMLGPSVENPTSARVVLTERNLLDDSVEQIRHIFTMNLNAHGEWKIITTKTDYKCQKGRGHRFFSRTPCR